MVSFELTWQVKRDQQRGLSSISLFEKLPKNNEPRLKKSQFLKGTPWHSWRQMFDYYCDAAEDQKEQNNKNKGWKLQ